MDINENISRANSGFFYSGDTATIGLYGIREQLNLKLVRKNLGGNCNQFQLLLKNNSERVFRINSLMPIDIRVAKATPSEVLENSWTQSGPSRYRRGLPITRINKKFFLRDQNPFSFREDYGYLNGSLVSEWYTQIKFGETYVLIGATSIADQFSQVFVKGENGGTRIRVTCQTDGIEIEPGGNLVSEKIVFLVGGKEETLKKFGNLVKAENGIKKTAPQLVGFTSAYYYQGRRVNEKYVLDELSAIKKLKLKFKHVVLEIDDPTGLGLNGLGDWPEAFEKHFPRGLKFVADRIKKQGLIPAIWMAPFIAGPGSRVFRQHPEWFLKDLRGRYFQARLTSPFDFLPFLSFYAADPTNREYLKYISGAVKKMVAYGFKLINLDFLYPVCFSTQYNRKMTRAQALRRALIFIKKAAGKGVTIKTCITQLSPLVGVADYVRVGLDTLNPFILCIPVVRNFVNNYMLSCNLNNSEARSFLSGRVWTNDADCLIFRRGTGISRKLVRKHRQFVRKNQLPVWLGDKIAALSKTEMDDLSAFLSGH